VPFTATKKATDHTLFRKVTWGFEEPNSAPTLGWSYATDAENPKALERKRVAFFRIRKIYESRPHSVEDYQEALPEFLRHVEDKVKKDQDPYATKKWLSDTWEQIF
jgi:hypothetical protein